MAVIRWPSVSTPLLLAMCVGQDIFFFLENSNKLRRRGKGRRKEGGKGKGKSKKTCF